MKKICLSAVAVIALSGTMLQAETKRLDKVRDNYNNKADKQEVVSEANTLSEAFTNGKFNGELRTMYISTNDHDVPNSFSNTSTFAAGGFFNYKTADFYGLNLGFTVQHSSQFGLNDSVNANGTLREDGRVGVSVTNFSQAYVEYNFDKNNSIKLGRQYMFTPLISSTPLAWMLIDSYEAYNFTTKSVPDTIIQAGILTKYLQRDAGVTSADTVDFHDPIYNIFVQNKSVDNLVLKGQILHMNGESGLQPIAGMNPFPILERNFLYSYADARYKLPTSLPVELRGIYYNLDYDTIADGDKYILGTSVGLGNFKLSFDYGQVSDDQAIIGTIGDTPTIDPLVIQSTDGSWRGMESYVAKLDINMKGFGIDNFRMMQFVHGEFESEVENREFSNTAVDIMYNHTGFLKGLTTRVRFANIHYDRWPGITEDQDRNEVRFMTMYKF